MLFPFRMLFRVQLFKILRGSWKWNNCNVMQWFSSIVIFLEKHKNLFELKHQNLAGDSSLKKKTFKHILKSNVITMLIKRGWI